MDQTADRGPQTVDRDWLTYVGLGIPAVAAVALSFAAWSGLAVYVGVDQHVAAVHLSWLLPLSIDAIGMTATRVWVMDRTVTDRTRRLARWTALATIALSFAGNGLFHLVPVLGLRSESSWWAVVVLITGLPAVLYFASAHLIVRLRADRRSILRSGMVRSAPKPAGPAVPGPVGPAASDAREDRATPPPVLPGPSRSSELMADRLAVLRSTWPDSVPTKRQVMDRLDVRASSTALALMRQHKAWVEAQSTPKSSLHIV